jgi:carbamate kinase
MIQVEEAITKIPPQSLDVAVAQTQGSMGYMLANQLRNRFNEEQLEKDIAAVLTEVEVDREDPAFENPAKPVGPYFTAYRANLLMQEHGWQMVEDAGRGWRKVVASPMPQRILGSHLLKRSPASSRPTSSSCLPRYRWWPRTSVVPINAG